MRCDPPKESRTRRSTPVTDYRWFVYRMACLGAAWAHAGRHENQEALRYYNRVLARRQDDELATLGKADALLALERTDDAELLFSRVLKDQPDNQYALAGMAIIKLNRGELDEAEDDFERAASLAGRNFTCPYEGLGLVYLRQGKTEKAKESFEKAIEINPDVDTRKFNELARIYVREQRYAEAEKLLLKSIENDPQNREAIKLLKTVREAAARTERANAPARAETGRRPGGFIHVIRAPNLPTSPYRASPVSTSKRVAIATCCRSPWTRTRVIGSVEGLTAYPGVDEARDEEVFVLLI